MERQIRISTAFAVIACLLIASTMARGAWMRALPPHVQFVKIAALPGWRPVHYSTWVNYRFDIEFDLPDVGLVPGTEPEDGDGRGFASRDGLSVNVFGQNNAMFYTVPQQCSLDMLGYGKGLTITYRRIAKNWFVFSGYLGRNIIYEKTVYHDEQFDVLEIEYPKSKAARFDPIAAHIARSFRYVPHAWVVDGEQLAGTDPLDQSP
jgi:hypothetical protein